MSDVVPYLNHVIVYMFSLTKFVDFVDTHVAVDQEVWDPNIRNIDNILPPVEDQVDLHYEQNYVDSWLTKFGITGAQDLHVAEAHPRKIEDQK